MNIMMIIMCASRMIMEWMGEDERDQEKEVKLGITNHSSRGSWDPSKEQTLWTEKIGGEAYEKSWSLNPLIIISFPSFQLMQLLL